MHKLHRFAWLPLVNGGVSIPLAILLVMLFVAPLGVEGLAKLTSPGAIRDWSGIPFTAAVIGISMLLWRNAAAGNYFDDKKTFLRVAVSVLSLFLVLFVISYFPVFPSLYLPSCCPKTAKAPSVAFSVSALIITISTASFFLLAGNDRIRTAGVLLKRLADILRDASKLNEAAAFRAGQSTAAAALAAVNNLANENLPQSSMAEVIRLTGVLAQVNMAFADLNELLLYAGSPAEQRLRQLGNALQ